MTLVYQSTRDEKNTVTASQAILQGLATDGGLFTPVSYPQVELDFDTLKDASYQEVAKLVLSAFLDDFTAEELDYCISHAYDSKFDTPAIAPLVKLDGQYNLELFHGSTIAFKDMALSILPYFMTTAAKKHGLENKIVILTALLEIQEKLLWQVLLMFQGQRSLSFIQKMVSARCKNCK